MPLGTRAMVRLACGARLTVAPQVNPLGAMLLRKRTIWTTLMVTMMMTIPMVMAIRVGVGLVGGYHDALAPRDQRTSGLCR